MQYEIIILYNNFFTTKKCTFNLTLKITERRPSVLHF